MRQEFDMLFIILYCPIVQSVVTTEARPFACCRNGWSWQ
jgi:hypothetical protein